MSGSGFRGRGFGPRGARPNGPANAFMSPRFPYPKFNHPRPPPNRLPGPDGWIERLGNFPPWQPNANFPQRPKFRGNLQFRPNGRGRAANVNNRGLVRFPGPGRPPFPIGLIRPPIRHKAPISLEEIAQDKSHIPLQTPLLGSEEERQQKISETADKLKQKLSSITEEDLTDFWDDDLSVVPNSNAEDKSEERKDIPALLHEPPELDLTFTDFRDIGRVDSDNSKTENVENITDTNDIVITFEGDATHKLESTNDEITIVNETTDDCLEVLDPIPEVNTLEAPLILLDNEKEDLESEDIGENVLPVHLNEGQLNLSNTSLSSNTTNTSVLQPTKKIEKQTVIHSNSLESIPATVATSPVQDVPQVHGPHNTEAHRNNDIKEQSPFQGQNSKSSASAPTHLKSNANNSQPVSGKSLWGSCTTTDIQSTTPSDSHSSRLPEGDESQPKVFNGRSMYSPRMPGSMYHWVAPHIGKNFYLRGLQRPHMHNNRMPPPGHVMQPTQMNLIPPVFDPRAPPPFTHNLPPSNHEPHNCQMLSFTSSNMPSFDPSEPPPNIRCPLPVPRTSPGQEVFNPRHQTSTNISPATVEMLQPPPPPPLPPPPPPPFDPREPPPAIVCTSGVIEKLPDFNPQQPPPRIHNQDSNMQRPPMFNSRLISQDQSNVTGHLSLDTSGLGTLTETQQNTDFNQGLPAANFSQSSPANVSSPQAFIQMNYQPNASHINAGQMIAHKIPLPPPSVHPVDAEIPLPPARNLPADIENLNKDCTGIIDDGLEDMQEAMEFAKQIMSMTTETDKSENSTPLISVVSPRKLGLLALNDGEHSAHAMSPNRTNAQPTAKTKVSNDTPIASGSVVYGPHLLPEMETNVVEQNTKEQTVKRQEKIVEDAPLAIEQLRPKVVFNLNSKSKRISKVEEWHHQNEEARYRRQRAASQFSEGKRSSNRKRLHVDQEKSTQSKDLTNRKKNNAAKSVAQKKDHIGSKDSRFSETAQPTTSERLVQQYQADKSHEQVLNSEPLNVLDTPKAQKFKRQTKKTDPSTPESSWKTKVINRFLKMSKNDIYNMVNNSSLRKFDIAMKHLVKERRSSLSLEIRNTEDERMKEYDREEFMNQLNAMLDPGAVVDITNLPTEFIHHLSEVLQLDSMPLGSELCPRPEGEINEAENIQQSDISIIEAVNVQAQEVPILMQPQITDSVCEQTENMETTFLKELQTEDSEELITRDCILHAPELEPEPEPEPEPDCMLPKTVEQKSDSLPKESTANETYPKEDAPHKKQPLFNVADLDDILSEVTARTKRTPKPVLPQDYRKSNTEAHKSNSSLKPRPENSRNKDSGVISKSKTSNRPVDTDNYRSRKSTSEDRSTYSGGKYERWSRKEREDLDAFRNLTKEEWEAKYGRPKNVSVSSSGMRRSNSNSSDNSSYRERRSYHAQRHCLSDSPMRRLSISPLVREPANTEKHSNQHYYKEPRGEENSETSTDSSTTTSSSSSDTDDGQTVSADVTKLLKVIKENEKIGKQKSLNETIRDEVAAEIERTWKEKSKYKERKAYKQKRRKDKRLKRKKDRKKKKKKFVKSPEVGYTERKEESRLLTESQIKKEVIVKEEPNTVSEDQITSSSEVVNSESLSLVNSDVMESVPILQRKSHSAETDKQMAPAIVCSTLQTELQQARSAIVTTTIQPKTKAQLKQMPEPTLQSAIVENTVEAVTTSMDSEAIRNETAKSDSCEVTSASTNPHKNKVTSVSNETFRSTESPIRLGNPVQINDDRNKKTDAISVVSSTVHVGMVHVQSDEHSKISDAKEGNQESNQIATRIVIDTVPDNMSPAGRNEGTASKKIDIKMYKERALQRRRKEEEEKLKNSEIQDSTANKNKPTADDFSNNEDSMRDANEAKAPVQDSQVDKICLATDTSLLFGKSSTETVELHSPSANAILNRKESWIRSDESTVKKRERNASETTEILKSSSSPIKYKASKTLGSSSKLDMISKKLTQKLKAKETPNRPHLDIKHASDKNQKDFKMPESAKFRNIRSEGSKELKLKNEKLRKSREFKRKPCKIANYREHSEKHSTFQKGDVLQKMLEKETKQTSTTNTEEKFVTEESLGLQCHDNELKCPRSEEGGRDVPDGGFKAQYEKEEVTEECEKRKLDVSETVDEEMNRVGFEDNQLLSKDKQDLPDMQVTVTENSEKLESDVLPQENIGALDSPVSTSSVELQPPVLETFDGIRSMEVPDTIDDKLVLSENYDKNDIRADNTEGLKVATDDSSDDKNSSNEGQDARSRIVDPILMSSEDVMPTLNKNCLEEQSSKESKPKEKQYSNVNSPCRSSSPFKGFSKESIEEDICQSSALLNLEIAEELAEGSIAKADEAWLNARLKDELILECKGQLLIPAGENFAHENSKSLKVLSQSPTPENGEEQSRAVTKLNVVKSVTKEKECLSGINTPQESTGESNESSLDENVKAANEDTNSKLNICEPELEDYSARDASNYLKDASVRVESCQQPAIQPVNFDLINFNIISKISSTEDQRDEKAENKNVMSEKKDKSNLINDIPDSSLQPTNVTTTILETESDQNTKLDQQMSKPAEKLHENIPTSGKDGFGDSTSANIFQGATHTEPYVEGRKESSKKLNVPTKAALKESVETIFVPAITVTEVNVSSPRAGHSRSRDSSGNRVHSLERKICEIQHTQASTFESSQKTDLQIETEGQISVAPALKNSGNNTQQHSVVELEKLKKLDSLVERKQKAVGRSEKDRSLQSSKKFYRKDRTNFLHKIKHKVKHRQHQKKNISAKKTQEAVKSGTVQFTQPITKEGIMARMIEIDVEIHKLMTEKMTLYQMLESGPTLTNTEQINTASDNKEEESIIRPRTPSVLMSQLIQNIDVNPTAGQSSSRSNAQTKDKVDCPQNEKHKTGKHDYNPRKRNALSYSSEDSEVMQQTDNDNLAKKGTKKQRIDRNVRWDQLSEPAATKCLLRDMLTEKKSCGDTTKSILKKDGKQELGEENILAALSENHPPMETENGVQLTMPKLSQEVELDSRHKENVGESFSQSDGKASPYNNKIVNAKVRSKKKIFDVSVEPRSCNSEAMDKLRFNDPDSSHVNKGQKKKSREELQMSHDVCEKEADSLNEELAGNLAPKLVESRTPENLSIYSDDSTWESFLQPPGFDAHEQKKPSTGLALLEETFKKEIAKARQMKAQARKKRKKRQLQHLLKSVNTLTSDEEELPLSTLYIKKLQQKKDLLDSLEQRNDEESHNPDQKTLQNEADSVNAIAEKREGDFNALQAEEQIPAENKTAKEQTTDSSAVVNDDGKSIETRQEKVLLKVCSFAAERIIGKISPELSVDIQEKSADEVKQDAVNGAKKSKIISNTSTVKPVAEEYSKESENSLDTQKGIKDTDDHVPLVRAIENPDTVVTELGECRKSPEHISEVRNARSEKSDARLTSSGETIRDKLNDLLKKSNAHKSTHRKETYQGTQQLSPTVQSEKEYVTTGAQDLSTATVSSGSSELAKTAVEVTSEISSQPKFDNLVCTREYADFSRLRKESEVSTEMSGDEDYYSSTPTSSIIENVRTPRAEDGSGRKKRKRGNGNIPTRRSSRYTEETVKRTKLEMDTNIEQDTQEKSLHAQVTGKMLVSSLVCDEEVESAAVNTKKSRGVRKSQSPRKRITYSESESYPSILISDDSTSRQNSMTEIEMVVIKQETAQNLQKAHTTQQMMNCKVRLVDSKYTILKPDISINILRKHGISSINCARSGSAQIENTINVAPIGESSNLKLTSMIDAIRDQNLKSITKPMDTVQPIVEQCGLAKMKKMQRLEKTSSPVPMEKMPHAKSDIDIIHVTTKEPSIKDVSGGCEKPDVEIIKEEMVIEDNQCSDNSSSTLSVIEAKEDKDKDKELPRTQYTVHKGPILDIKVFGNSFLAASEDGTIYRYSQTSNGILNIYKGHNSAVTCLYVYSTESADNVKELMFSGSLDGTLRCYNIMTGGEVRKPADVGSPVQCMDQAWGVIFVGTKSGHVSRYHIKSGGIKGDSIQFSEKSVLALKATNEGPRKVLIVASRNQPITIRDAQSGLFLRTICGQRSHTVYSLMRHNNFIYCGTSSTSILVFDFTNGEQTMHYDAGVGIVCMRLYQHLLFAGCYDGNIYVFNTKDHRLTCSIPGPGNMLLSMEIVDNKIIAGSKDKRLQSWQMPKQVRALFQRTT